MYEANDVVRIRHPFYGRRAWIVERTLPSLKENILLHRITMLRRTGERGRITVTVTGDQIVEHLGGYEQWRQQNRNSVH